MAIRPARMMTSEQTLARIGRRMNVSAAMAIPLLRRRRRGAALHGDRRPVGELLHARRDDPLARLDALEDRIILPDDRPDLDRALFRDELAAGVLRDEREHLAADPQYGGDRHDQAAGG